MERKAALQVQHDAHWRETLAITADAGFRYVSMGFGSSRCFHRDDWREETAAIRSYLDALGLRCVMTHAPYYDLRISAEFTDDAMETALLRCTEATAMLGGDIMAIHPRGFYRGEGETPADGFYPDGREIPEESLRINVRNIRPLAEKAETCGCRIGIENLPVFPGWAMTFCSNDPDIHRRLIDAFDPRTVCGVWDFGHAYLANEDPSGTLATFKGRIAGTHVHDNDRSGDQHLTPLLGTIDWEMEMAALRSTGFDGYLTMELEYPDPVSDPETAALFIRRAYENICRIDGMLRR